MKKRVLIFGHGSGINRGCEAIIKTITDLIKSVSDVYITVCATDMSYDKMIDYSNIDKFIEYPRYKQKSIKWVLNKIDERFISGGKYFIKKRCPYIIDEIKNSDLCISVGGDNYCYNIPYRYIAFDYYVKKYKKPLVMYGSSIEPSMMKGIVKKDLERYDMIIARESITSDALKEFLPENRVYLCPDPAFTLKCSKVVLPENWETGNVVGLNVSPLILRYEQKKDIVLKAVHNLINEILKNGRQILFVPHVMQPGNNDYTILHDLYDKYKSSNRVFILSDNLRADQYKGFISNCCMFIGARTHATIAAYSTMVPTYVIGYSVKSLGIDHDIYNNKYKMLISVKDIDSDDKLVKSYLQMENQLDEIKGYLNCFIPHYIERAKEGITKINEWLV